jgi:hypothetical protein
MQYQINEAPMSVSEQVWQGMDFRLHVPERASYIRTFGDGDHSAERRMGIPRKRFVCIVRLS